jgi:hypothetical protein
LKSKLLISLVSRSEAHVPMATPAAVNAIARFR